MDVTEFTFSEPKGILSSESMKTVKWHSWKIDGGSLARLYAVIGDDSGFARIGATVPAGREITKADKEIIIGEAKKHYGL